MTSKKGKALRSKQKRLVADVSQHFEKEKCNESFIQETAEATGYSSSTVLRVRKELRETGTLTSPKRPKTRGQYKPIDGFDEHVIRNKFHELYMYRRQLPTLKNLHVLLKQDINYPGSIWLLQQTLKQLGFTWRRTVDNRKVLMERPHVVAQRIAYYGRKRDLEERGFTLVYVDETWVDTSYTAKRCWQSNTFFGAKPPINRGQRLIVVNYGSNKGLVDGAQLVCKASSSTGDYHREMNGQNFTKWVQEKLIPNLQTPSSILMDNASYHSMQFDKFPTTSSGKADIQEWLRKHSINFHGTMVKTQLLQLAKAHKPAPSYTIDQIIRSHGHEVIRLPPYHPELNAIELIWSQLKSFVRSRNVTFRLDDMQKLVAEGLSEIGEDRWRHACEHVEKVETQLKASDLYKGDRPQQVVINLGDDTTDTANMDSSTDTASESEYF